MIFFQWVPEIAHYCSKTPFLLVGTQVDLRDDPLMLEKLAKNKQKPISYEVGENILFVMFDEVDINDVLFTIDGFETDVVF